MSDDEPNQPNEPGDIVDEEVSMDDGGGAAGVHEVGQPLSSKQRIACYINQWPNVFVFSIRKPFCLTLIL